MQSNAVSAAHEAVEQHIEARVELPSRRTPAGGDVWVWCKEKAQHDSKLGGSDCSLWMVHGKWYDLSKYMHKHPGGADWMKLTQGQDITEAFEVHHLNEEKVNAVLKTLYVKDADPGYVSRYQWDENGFYKTLKRRVRKLFGTRQDGLPDTGPTPAFNVMCVCAMVVHFSCFTFLLSFPSLILAALAGFTLQTFHGIGHDRLHMKDNWFMYAYDFCGWKHHKHRISHALSHHLHPNTLIDLEHPENSWLGIPGSFVFTSNAFQNSRWVVLTGPFMMWSGPLRDILSLWHGLAMGKEPFRPEYIFNMMQLVLLGLAAGPMTGFMCFCIMHFVCGFCIECAGFGLHRSSFCWSHGDANEKYDFGEHALAATADHDVDMGLLTSLYLFQILNNHGIHHLFPTIDKSRILEVMPIFRETCQEFGVPWMEYAWQDMFGSLWKVWLKGLYTETPWLSTPARGHAIVPGSSLRITPIEGQTFGAVVTGVKLQECTDEEFHVIKKAWVERGVLVIRDQDLTPDQEFEFATRFPHNRTCSLMQFCGPLAKEGFDAAEWQKFKLKSRPEIQLRGYGQLNDHYGVTGFLDTGKGALEYHSDSLHEYQTPPIFTSLYCLITPGGDETLFIDCARAYDLLSDAEKARVECLFVQYKREPWPLHKSGLKADPGASLDTLGDLYGRAVAANSQGDDIIVSEVHPLVWTHPSTGRKAIISASMWMYRMVEADGTAWSPEASHDYLYKLLKPVADHQYPHVWQPGDLVCFDNRQLMHSAKNTPSKQRDRLLHQIILCGDQIPSGPAGVGVGNPQVNPNIQGVR